MLFNVKIHATGSSGNMVQIDNTIIDLGVTKSKAMQLVNFDEIDEVFISHKHSDHCTPALIKEVVNRHIPLYVSEDTNNKFNLINEDSVNIYLIEELNNKPNHTIDNCRYNRFQLKNGTYIYCIPQKHDDIINYAFVFEKGNDRLLYSTDLDTLEKSDVGDGILHLGMFDVILLEGNYDEIYLREYIGKKLKEINADIDIEHFTDQELERFVKRNYQMLEKETRQILFRAVQNLRHLSKLQARAYARNHLKENGTYYEIHRSSKFYEKDTIE